MLRHLLLLTSATGLLIAHGQQFSAYKPLNFPEAADVQDVAAGDLDNDGRLDSDATKTPYVLEDTGLNRMLGSAADDELYGGTGVDFMFGNGGTRFDPAGNTWTPLAGYASQDGRGEAGGGAVDVDPQLPAALDAQGAVKPQMAEGHTVSDDRRT